MFDWAILTPVVAAIGLIGGIVAAFMRSESAITREEIRSLKETTQLGLDVLKEAASKDIDGLRETIILERSAMRMRLDTMDNRMEKLENVLISYRVLEERMTLQGRRLDDNEALIRRFMLNKIDENE